MSGPAVAIFGSSRTEPGSPEWIEAEKAGTRCAGAGLAVITGGYGGTMEAVSKGAALAGGRVIGVTAAELFRDRSGANTYVTEEIPSKTLTDRIGILTELASGAIALPGSIGTAAELVVAWNMHHIARLSGGSRKPTAAVGNGWRQVSLLFADGIGAFMGDIEWVDTADQAVDWLLQQPEIHASRRATV